MAVKKLPRTFSAEPKTVPASAVVAAVQTQEIRPLREAELARTQLREISEVSVSEKTPALLTVEPDTAAKKAIPEQIPIEPIDRMEGVMAIQAVVESPPETLKPAAVTPALEVPEPIETKPEASFQEKPMETVFPQMHDDHEVPMLSLEVNDTRDTEPDNLEVIALASDDEPLAEESPVLENIAIELPTIDQDTTYAPLISVESTSEIEPTTETLLTTFREADTKTRMQLIDTAEAITHAIKAIQKEASEALPELHELEQQLETLCDTFIRQLGLQPESKTVRLLKEILTAPTVGAEMDISRLRLLAEEGTHEQLLAEFGIIKSLLHILRMAPVRLHLLGRTAVQLHTKFALAANPGRM